MVGKKFVASALGQSDSAKIIALEKEVAELKGRVDKLTELVKGSAPQEKKFEDLTKAELEELCAEYGIETKGLNKAQLVQALYTRG